MAISSISSKFGEYAAKGLGKFADSKNVRGICEKFKNDPIKYAGYATLASLALKDTVGCYMYVTQSLNNKKIPEEKRRFVANMDLTNGILNVITQIGLTFGVKKLYKPMFNKMLNKSFNKNAYKEIITLHRKDSRAMNTDVLRKLEANKELEKTKNNIYSAFAATMDIFVATILAKRVVVPFLSTPITQTLTNRHDKKLAEKKAAMEQQKPAENKPKTPETPTANSVNENTNLLTKFQQ